jgi:hypothetical protein
MGASAWRGGIVVVVVTRVLVVVVVLVAHLRRCLQQGCTSAGKATPMRRRFSMRA